MEKEAVSVSLRKSLRSSKEFVSNGYHSFANYIRSAYKVHKEKGRNQTLKMAFAKYSLVLLNIFYMLTSLVMINIGTIGKIISNGNYFGYYIWPELNMLSIYWIATGVILLFASVFGLIGALRESIIWTNIFGVLMAIGFLIQISSAIIAFQFIVKSDSIATRGINELMSQYDYNYYSIGQTKSMDLIQRSFQCCGNNGPTDWNRFSKYARPTSNNYNHNYYPYQPTTTTTTTTLSTPLRDRMPSSCCMEGSNYNNLSCDEYYHYGCRTHVREVISETVMIIGSVALGIAVLEMLGIVFAFVVAKIMRKTKSLIAIQHYDGLHNQSPSAAQAAKTIETTAEDVETI